MFFAYYWRFIRILFLNKPLFPLLNTSLRSLGGLENPLYSIRKKFFKSFWLRFLLLLCFYTSVKYIFELTLF